MGKMTKKEMPMWAKSGHAKPNSRREFLAHGIIPFAASALVPNLLNILVSPEARAEAACASPSGILPSFITINLSGGPGLAANFIPRDAGGQLLPSYGKLGGGTAANIALANDLALNGMQPFAASSGLLAGLKLGAPTALANTSVVAVHVQSRDDNAQNLFDASGMVYQAGLAGGMLPNMGTRATTTGISQFPSVVSPPSPLIVGSVNDIKNSIGYTAALSKMTSDQKQKVARLVSSLSASQANKLTAQSSTAPIRDLIACAGISNTGLIGQGGSAVDPTTQAPALNTIWGITANTNANTQNYVYATMVYNSLAGNGGVVGLDMGGFDYHDGTRSTGDAKDKSAGMVIGQVLESAKAMNKKVFVYVCADGATTSTDSATPGSPWISDRGTGGMSLMFMYDPAGRPATTGLQIGNFTTGQVADDTTFVGSDPGQSAQAVFANYLSFSGRMDLLSNILPTNGTLSGAVLQSILKI